MSNAFTIAPVPDDAQEIATDTRNALAAWIAERTSDKAAPVSLTAGCRKKFKDEGRDEFLNQVEPAGTVATGMFAKLTLAFLRASESICDEYFDDTETAQIERMTYCIEGAANAYTKALHDAGVKRSLPQQRLAALSLIAPGWTSGAEDTEVRNLLGTQYFVDSGFARWSRVGHRYMEKACNSHSDQRMLNAPAAYLGRTAIAVMYTDAGEAWVAGFLNAKDMGNFRFTRMKFGAWLIASGEFSDADAQQAVDQYLSGSANASFKFLPNDICWADAYMSDDSEEGGSCMSGGLERYGLWDDMHPVMAYSAAFRGAGDNGLVLMTARDSDDNMIGRGILNVDTFSIVRWYGDHDAKRALAGLKIPIDYRALKGSWLALLLGPAKVNKKNPYGMQPFVHPYVDGYHVYGKIEGNRVLLKETNAGHIELQTTCGSSMAEPAVWATDLQATIPHKNAVFQPVTRNYVSDRLDATKGLRCWVTNEFIERHQVTHMHIDGEERKVCYQVDSYSEQYLIRLNDGGGWPQPVKYKLNPEWAEKAKAWRTEPEVPVAPEAPKAADVYTPPAPQATTFLTPREAFEEFGLRRTELPLRTGTVTGRMSSSQPALQELPRRTASQVLDEAYQSPAFLADFSASEDRMAELERQQRQLSFAQLYGASAQTLQQIATGTSSASSQEPALIDPSAAPLLPTLIQSTESTGSSSSSSLTELESLLPMDWTEAKAS